MKTSLILVIALLLVTSSGCGGGGPVTPPDGPGDGRVPNYTLLFPDKICRWENSSFPVRVWIDQPPSSVGQYAPYMINAAGTGLSFWNNVIDGVPLTFVLVSSQDQCDITVRWETMNVGGYTLATEFSNRIRIRKIALNEGLRDPNLIQLIMGHELGHVLGLDLSGVQNDLMFSTLSNETSLTQRDRDMLNWLYDQANFFPIRSE